MLKRDPSKVEAMSEVCCLFFYPKEQRVLVSTNTRFLEQDYMLDNKPRSKVILDELRAELNEGNEVPIP